MAGKNKDIRILIVDDEAFVLNLAVRILNKLGYENIETASDGSFALGQLEAHDQQFDLVICDLNMPETDGIEFMRLAHDNGYAGALLFLSGEDRRMLETAMDLARAHKINVIGAIQKPLKPDTLEPILEKFDPSPGMQQFTPQETISREELEAGITDPAVSGLTLFYQPKVNIRTGEISNVEALARWQHAERGLLGPGAFIPLAEEAGLINPLTFAVYRQAVQQVSEWLVEGLNLTASINVSINTFTMPNFSNFLIDTAQGAGISPQQVMLEVTESQVMENAMSCLEILMRLRLKKFGLSIDDFGTGNSSMAQLKSIPFSELKIDRAFVYGAADNASTRAILEASVDLAKKLDMVIVAEGAETREDWDLCEKLGIDYVQGYYCAKPMPNDQLMAFLESWSGPH